eukprot:TRINITY_DN1007_c1_g1_i1.p2 TRINITY_DN1007_c1_g1~~TRINITY_DN1007_c1_g1_i1.p2  ORF type:complete len:199 (+),score=0.36 TRINITY_DN1007_c1_g1_i1:780-1376(+)
MQSHGQLQILFAVAFHDAFPTGGSVWPEGIVSGVGGISNEGKELSVIHSVIFDRHRAAHNETSTNALVAPHVVLKLVMCREREELSGERLHLLDKMFVDAVVDYLEDSPVLAGSADLVPDAASVGLVFEAAEGNYRDFVEGEVIVSDTRSLIFLADEDIGKVVRQHNVPAFADAIDEKGGPLVPVGAGHGRQENKQQG